MLVCRYHFDLNLFYTTTQANFVVFYPLFIVYLCAGEWSQLCSLDLICDSPKAFEKWTSAVSRYRCDKEVN